jgi:hypothetical protein
MLLSDKTSTDETKICFRQYYILSKETASYLTQNMEEASHSTT